MQSRTREAYEAAVDMDGGKLGKSVKPGKGRIGIWQRINAE